MEIIGRENDNVKNYDMDKFKHWWSNTGSGIRPVKNEDQETYIKRVCEEFYMHLCEITPGLDTCAHPYKYVSKAQSCDDLDYCNICGDLLT